MCVCVCVCVCFEVTRRGSLVLVCHKGAGRLLQRSINISRAGRARACCTCCCSRSAIPNRALAVFVYVRSQQLLIYLHARQRRVPTCMRICMCPAAAAEAAPPFPHYSHTLSALSRVHALHSPSRYKYTHVLKRARKIISAGDCCCCCGCI